MPTDVSSIVPPYRPSPVAAASAHLYAAVPDLRLGCELFGPMRLSEDLVAESLLVQDGVIAVPAGPGLGVVLDEDRIAHLARRCGTAPSGLAPAA